MKISKKIFLGASAALLVVGAGADLATKSKTWQNMEYALSERICTSHYQKANVYSIDIDGGKTKIEGNICDNFASASSSSSSSSSSQPSSSSSSEDQNEEPDFQKFEYTFDLNNVENLEKNYPLLSKLATEDLHTSRSDFYAFGAVNTIKQLSALFESQTKLTGSIYYTSTEDLAM